MRLQTTLLAAVAATTFAAGAARAATVEIEDAVARVTVVPEDRSDIKIEVVSPNARLPLTVRTVGDRTILDGDLDRHTVGQDVEHGRPRPRLLHDLPQLLGRRVARDREVDTNALVPIPDLV